ncbi:MAG: triphosphoribosyl-dephospho-CoA synthase [Methylomicrobium sp.]
MISVKILEDCYRQACEIELQAFKPGNVSVYADGHDMTVEDFRVSAEVSASSMANPDYSLGEKIYHAVKATREAVGCNTNLGIVLLCAPLLQAAWLRLPQETLRQALHKVLRNSTIEDADWVFNAIVLASPGGLGSSDEQDVVNAPAVTLFDAMKIAEKRDRIAFQYCSDYKDIFDFGVLRYNAGLTRWAEADWAAVAVYVGLLSLYPDSHIERKYGDRFTLSVASKMSLIDRALQESDRPESIVPLLCKIDTEFKSEGINPGTTADLTVATVLAVLLEDRISN